MLRWARLHRVPLRIACACMVPVGAPIDATPDRPMSDSPSSVSYAAKAAARLAGRARRPMRKGQRSAEPPQRSTRAQCTPSGASVPAWPTVTRACRALVYKWAAVGTVRGSWRARVKLFATRAALASSYFFFFSCEKPQKL